MRRPVNVRLAFLGILSLGLLVLFFLGPVLLPFGATEIGAGGRLVSPSLTHFMGTDHMGRDVFARALSGAGVTVLVSLGALSIGALAGLVVGAVAGYFGGLLDEVVMRVSDGVCAFPSVLLALVIMSLTGPGTGNLVLVLGVLFIPSFARVARGAFQRARNLDYVKRARLTGASDLWIMLVHILPGTLPVYLSAVAIGFNNAVLAEASMSFLGLGVQQPQVSLGRMLAESQSYLFSAPWMALSAGGTIVLLVFVFSLLAQGGGGRHALRRGSDHKISG